MSAQESTVAPNPTVAAGSDVFLSYARADREAAEAIAHGLGARGRSLWVDWEGIPPTAEWMAEIRAGIDAASGVLFLLSPQSARSRVCTDELEHALAAGKRIVPVVVKDVEPAALPEQIRRLNWVFARPADDLGAALDSIEQGLDLDLDVVRLHTRLLVRSREWLSADQDSGRLLRGGELAQAERWLAASPTDPAPTAEQRRFVLASRAGASRRQRRQLALVSAALVVALALGVFAFVQRNAAVVSQRRATRVALSADSERLGAQAINVDDPKLGLLLAVEGYQLEDTAASRSNLLAALEHHDGKLFSVSVGYPVLDIARGPADLLDLVDVRNAASGWSTTTHKRVDYLGTGPARVVATNDDGRTAVIQKHRDSNAGTTRVQDATAEYSQFTGLPDTANALVTPAWAGTRLLTAKAADSNTTPEVAGTVQLDDPDHPNRPPVTRDLGGRVGLLAASSRVAVAVSRSARKERVSVLDPTTLAIRNSIALDASSGSVTAVAVSADGSHLALGFGSGAVSIATPDARSVTLLPRDHNAPVTRLAFSPDGTRVASGGRDGWVILRRTTDGLRTRWFDTSSPVTGLVWDRAGDSLYAATDSGRLLGFDVAPAHALASFIGGPLPVPQQDDLRLSLTDGNYYPGLAIPPDGRDNLAVTDGGGRAVSIGHAGSPPGNPARGAGIGSLATSTGDVRRAAIQTVHSDPTTTNFDPIGLVLTKDGKNAVVLGDGGLAAVLWDLRSMTQTGTATAPRPNDSPPRASRPLITPDGHSIVYFMTSGKTPVLRRFDLQPFTSRADLRLHAKVASATLPWWPIGWAEEDGRILIAACGVGCIARVDTASGAVTAISDAAETRGTGGDTGRRGSRVDGDHSRRHARRGRRERRHVPTLRRTTVCAGVPLGAGARRPVGQQHLHRGRRPACDQRQRRLGRLLAGQDGSQVGPRLQVGFSPNETITLAALPGGRVLTLDGTGTARSVPATAAGWKALACTVAGRDLTTAEWDKYLPGRPYQRPVAETPAGVFRAGRPDSHAPSPVHLARRRLLPARPRGRKARQVQRLARRTVVRQIGTRRQKVRREGLEPCSA